MSGKSWKRKKRNLFFQVNFALCRWVHAVTYISVKKPFCSHQENGPVYESGGNLIRSGDIRLQTLFCVCVVSLFHLPCLLIFSWDPFCFGLTFFGVGRQALHPIFIFIQDIQVNREKDQTKKHAKKRKKKKKLKPSLPTAYG